MKSKVIKFCLFIIFIIGLYAIHLWSIDYYKNYQTIYIANYDISARTQIDDSMIKAIKVPDNDLIDNYYQSELEIIGKYVKNNNVIYQGQVISKVDVEDSKDMIDFDYLTLENSYSIYPIILDDETIASNNLVAGQKVNLFVGLINEKNNLIVDELIKNVEIKSIKDRNGLDINKEDSTLIPYIINISVKSEYLNLLIIADELGFIKLFGDNTTYNKNDSSVLKEESLVLGYLLK